MTRHTDTEEDERMLHVAEVARRERKRRKQFEYDLATLQEHTKDNVAANRAMERSIVQRAQLALEEHERLEAARAAVVRATPAATVFRPADELQRAPAPPATTSRTRTSTPATRNVDDDVLEDGEAL